jgi:hypothetical protein
VIGLCGIEAWVLADWMRQRRGARRVDDGEKPGMLDKAGSVLLHRSGSVGTLVSGVVSAVGFRLLGEPESSKWQRLTSDGRRAGD